MLNFQDAIAEKLAFFSPYLNEEITISSDYFFISKGCVADFVREIEHNAQQAMQQDQVLYTQFYTQRLITQFECLKQAVDKIVLKKANHLPKFHSPYRFAKNVKNLPRCQQLDEYRKALRALSEKISWLIEQQYATQNLEQRMLFQQYIQETEYRKQKCLAAIAELE